MKYLTLIFSCLAIIISSYALFDSNNNISPSDRLESYIEKLPDDRGVSYDYNYFKKVIRPLEKSSKELKVGKLEFNLVDTETNIDGIIVYYLCERNYNFNLILSVVPLECSDGRVIKLIRLKKIM